MSPEKLDIQATITEVRRLMREEPSLSPALRAALEMLLLVVKLLTDSAGLNSRNSSKPPSTDKQKIPRVRKPSGKKPGGQSGHVGVTRGLVDTPDRVVTLAIDQRTLPRDTYTPAGIERRQVIQITLEKEIVEYQAEVVVNSRGQRFVATFPDDVASPVQFGASVKAQAVYLSQYQLIPYERVQAQFGEMWGIDISTGSLFTFNQQAYQQLAMFEPLARKMLASQKVLHADETGVNINGKRLWLHCATNDRWTWIEPHAQRGNEAMNAIGILPAFQGILVHDHWAAYYAYGQAQHALCNAHHLRELQRAHEQDNQAWARSMQELLLAMHEAVKKAGGALSDQECRSWRKQYRHILKQGEQESPPAEKVPGKRGKTKNTKARNLLVRLRDYEEDVLRFLRDPAVAFSNNQAERDIRMTKVQQKISGCFRAFEGAQIFCRIRSYLVTCDKHGVPMGEAIEHIFNRTWPPFIQNLLDGAE